jgi:hypothetical protein
MIMVFGGQDWIDGDATQQLGAGSRPISETVGGRIREREDRPLGGPGVHDEARPFAEVTDRSAVLVLGPWLELAPASGRINLRTTVIVRDVTAPTLSRSRNFREKSRNPVRCRFPRLSSGVGRSTVIREDIVIANDTAIVTDGYPPASAGADR